MNVSPSAVRYVINDAIEQHVGADPDFHPLDPDAVKSLARRIRDELLDRYQLADRQTEAARVEANAEHLRRDTAAPPPAHEGTFTVTMLAVLRPAFVAWLYERGLDLVQIPEVNDPNDGLIVVPMSDDG